MGSEMTCPHCGGADSVAHTPTAAGSPRRWCRTCRRAWTPDPKPARTATPGPPCPRCGRSSKSRGTTRGVKRWLCQAGCRPASFVD